ncbi:hypothetical protein GCM10009839_46410 [Catenulispora yoronensis]|uniref:ANTAR domain-containing protein n=1 Tax=Catenulispora yoronensis TaxID=450799 RepID=A0ABN2UKY9_9ACTN
MTEPTPADVPNPQAPTSLIAVGTLSNWTGLPLHHAPGPAETAHLLHRLIMLRTKARTRAYDAHEQLLEHHPAGWIELGAPGRGGTRQARRAPSSWGRCLCHDHDGTAHPNPRLESSARIDSGQEPAPSIRHLFVIRREGLIVAARNPDLPDAEFDQVAFAEWTANPNFDGLDEAADKAASYTEDDRTANVLTWLTEAIGPASEADSSTLGFLLVGLHRYRADNQAQTRALATMARTAGVPDTDLRDHLDNVSHSQQLSLLHNARQALQH